MILFLLRAQTWAKPQPNGAVAVLVVNGDANPVGSVKITLADVNVSSTAKFTVFDIWKEEMLPGAFHNNAVT